MKATIAATLTALGLGSVIAPAHAQAQAQAQEPRVIEVERRYDSLMVTADEYFLYEDDSKQVVDYKSDRVIRVCLGDSELAVPVIITADEREMTLHAGDCMRVEAKQVWLEPDERLPDLTMLKVDVETLNY